ncbi:MAG: hypothetical protein BECKG1743D_GA0114223_109521 [Candidatus Kentron sp. G]|nr:MAG: hypothetical protein BECKG1743D_GA0114223_109521 [Candidatus Kentron sp. G]VFN07038.1 MAG: hypothetical protein BECKG1743E_GA0114224_111182 [Candidatus Kentron sp. G]
MVIMNGGSREWEVGSEGDRIARFLRARHGNEKRTYNYNSKGDPYIMKIPSLSRFGPPLAISVLVFGAAVPVSIDAAPDSDRRVSRTPWSESEQGIHYSDGNVGIGTDTPEVELDVYGTAALGGNSDDTVQLGSVGTPFTAMQIGQFDVGSSSGGQGNRMKVFLVLRNLCIIPKSTLRSQRYEYRFG